MKTFAATLVFGIALLGCASPAEQAAQDDATCHGYSDAGNAQGYAQCRYQLAAMRQQAQREAVISVADGVAAAGAAYTQPHPVQPAPYVSGCAWGYSCPDYSHY